MLVADLLMVFGPPMGYISQYNLIKNSRTLGNFSIDVCAILLISNILRLFYWYALPASQRFSKALILQALLMIVTQTLLLKLCIRVRNDQEGYRAKLQPQWKSACSFWRWSRFESFVLFLAMYTFVLGLVTLLMVDLVKSVSYGQMIGFVSLAIESVLGFPQMIKNCTQRNVEGVSIVLILVWFVGDFSKTLYFISFAQPMQFIMCGATQLTVDIIIMIQLVAFRKKEPSEQIGSIEVVDSPPQEKELESGETI